MLNKLPKDWKWVVSEEIMDIRDGTHATPKYVTENGIPLITSKNLKENKIDFEKISYISKEDHLEISKRSKVEEGDILFAMIGTIGNPAIIRQEAEFSIKNVGLFKKNKSVIEPEYFVNFLRSSFFQKQLSERKLLKGTTQKFIPLGNLRNIEIPLPPLATQQAIVSKIEELFSELDAGIQNLKTAQAQLKTYRQAVLKWAFEGKLTEQWRRKKTKLKTGTTFLEEIKLKRDKEFKNLKRKLKPIEEIDKISLGSLPIIPIEWNWVKIVETVLNTADDIVDGPFGSNLKNSDYVQNAPVPVISISNIEEGFKDNLRYITLEKFETIKRSAVYPGDIIVAKIGSTYGKTGLYPEWMPIGVIPANLLRIRPSNHYHKQLLVHYLKSAIFKKRLDSIMKSTAQPAYNVSMFKELPIPFMDFEEQKHIVEEIESRLSVADKMEESINQSLQQAEALKQSILKKAFEGGLN